MGGRGDAAAFVPVRFPDISIEEACRRGRSRIGQGVAHPLRQAGKDASRAARRPATFSTGTDAGAGRDGGNRMSSWTLPLSLAAVFVLAPPHAQTTLPRGTWEVRTAPAHLRDPVRRADLVVVALQDALLRELTNALNQGGPAFAINSCHIDVIGVTQRIGRERGVAAGRTSDRLRNPANAPKAWAIPLVAAHAGRPAREVDGFVVDLGEAVGVLRPIAHRPICASCHGPADELDPGVRAALEDRYPRDRATGFERGEIRGWFWVEMPKSRR